MTDQRDHRTLSASWASLLDGVWSDIRYAARGLRQTPAFTVAVAVTLALSIGASASIFSVLDQLYRQPSGVNDPDRVKRVHVKSHYFGRLNLYSGLGYPAWRDLPKVLPPAIQLAAYSISDIRISLSGDSVAVGSSGVVGNYFGLLGVRPYLGRFFAPDETRLEDPRNVAVISHRLWSDRFRGDPEIFGQVLIADAVKYTIIGVAPVGFHGVDASSADVWIPGGTSAASRGEEPDWYRSAHGYLRLIVRVPPALDMRAVENLARPGLGTDPWINDSNPVVELADLRQFVSDQERLGQFVAIPRRLALIAGIILLIAIVNVSGLLLVRALHRRRDIAVRLVLGISRGRLARQMISESLLLAASASAASLLVTYWSGAVLRRTMFAEIRWPDQPWDHRVVLFTIGLAAFVGLATGVVPVLQAKDPELGAMLRGNAPGASGYRSRIRTVLLSSQTALALLLVAAAGLYVGSLRNVITEHTGYDIDRLLQASVRTAPSQMNDSSTIVRRRTWDAQLPIVAERLLHIPGVEGVGMASSAPLMGGMPGVYVPGIDSLPTVGDRPAARVYVTPSYFSTVGIRVLSGRGFTVDDRLGAELVVVVNETMARALWPDGTAIGRCVVLGKLGEPCRRIVGVVSDQHTGTRTSQLSMYVFAPAEQTPTAFTYIGRFLFARVAPERRALVEREIRRELEQASAPWGRARVERVATWLEPELRPWRLTATLASTAGLLALLVACIGIYSSLAYAISHRKKEIGIRIALGAQGADLIRITMNDGIGAVLVGVAIGIALSIAVGKMLAANFFGTSPRDPIVLAAASVTLLLAAVAACARPTRNAMRLDPVTVLRTE